MGKAPFNAHLRPYLETNAGSEVFIPMLANLSETLNRDYSSEAHLRPGFLENFWIQLWTLPGVRALFASQVLASLAPLSFSIVNPPRQHINNGGQYYNDYNRLCRHYLQVGTIIQAEVSQAVGQDAFDVYPTILAHQFYWHWPNYFEISHKWYKE